MEGVTLFRQKDETHKTTHVHIIMCIDLKIIFSRLPAPASCILSHLFRFFVSGSAAYFWIISYLKTERQATADHHARLESMGKK